MAQTRLATALQNGLTMPEDVVVVNPTLGMADLPKARVVTGDAVVRDALAARDPQPSYDRAGAVVVCLPRSKSYARALIAEASAKADTLVLVDGQKTDGVDAIFRDLRKMGAAPGSLSKAHGRLIWLTPGADLSAWRDPGLTEGPAGFVTQPGVFSEAKVDAGSYLLAQHLPEDLSGHVVDLGAGWGYLSRQVLTCAAVTQLDLVEAQHRAIEAARANVTDARAGIHWADATRWRPDAQVDAVVMNPPFHTGRAAEPALGQAFITAAARMLSPRGRLIMVANRQLPYEAALSELFADTRQIAQDGAFKVLLAARPLR